MSEESFELFAIHFMGLGSTDTRVLATYVAEFVLRKELVEQVIATKLFSGLLIVSSRDFLWYTISHFVRTMRVFVYAKLA